MCSTYLLFSFFFPLFFLSIGERGKDRWGEGKAYSKNLTLLKSSSSPKSQHVCSCLPIRMLPFKFLLAFQISNINADHFISENRAECSFAMLIIIYHLHLAYARQEPYKCYMYIYLENYIACLHRNFFTWPLKVKLLSWRVDLMLLYRWIHTIFNAWNLLCFINTYVNK